MLYYFRNLTEECLEDNILWNRYGNNFPYYYYVKAKDTAFVRNYKFKVGDYIIADGGGFRSLS